MTEMTAEERARRLLKIKKCLALAASPEPHEAAAAMRQAQKMMSELGVSAEEVEVPDVIETLVKTREGYGHCRYMSLLTSIVETAFGVRVVLSRNPGSANRLNIKYIGPRAKAEMAQYTHVVLQRALEGAWSQHLVSCPADKQFPRARQSFYMGWLWAIGPQVSAMAPEEKEVLATERFMTLRYGALQEMESRKQKALDVAALRAGQRAAKDFSIHLPMTQEQLKIGRS